MKDPHLADFYTVETLRQQEARQIGQRLRQYRMERHLTQTQVALHMGLSYQSYQRYESGEAVVPADRLLAIAAILQISVQDLLPSAPGKPVSERLLARQEHGLTEEEYDLLEAYRRIEDREIRRALRLLATRFAEMR